MAKFYVVEKFYYEVEANDPSELPTLFQEFMESGNDESHEAKFLDNQMDFYDDNWDEVKPWL